MKYQTSSSLSAFRECPRKYFFAYELSRVPASETPSLSFGRVFHEVLAAWWTGGMSSAVIWLKEHVEAISVSDGAKFCALLHHYNPPKDQYEVLGVEVPFEVKIEHPDGGRAFYGYRLCGKVDLLLKRLDTGEVWICDHKTTASDVLGFGNYWRALQVDGQMNNYCLAFNARGFIYDVFHKPSIKLCGKDEKAAKEQNIEPGDAYQNRIESAILESPEGTYQWREHLKDEGDFREARLDLWQHTEMFRACAGDGRYPRNCGACVGRYGVCSYLEVCAGRAMIDDDGLFRTKERKHEELKPLEQSEKGNQ